MRYIVWREVAIPASCQDGPSGVAPPSGSRPPGLQDAPPRASRDSRGRLSTREVISQERELHRVLPRAMAEVGLPLHPFADETDALGVADRSLVEPVARELEPVVAELE